MNFLIGVSIVAVLVWTVVGVCLIFGFVDDLGR